MRRGRHIERRKSGIVKNVVLIVMIVVFLGGLVYALYPVMTGLALVHESRTVSQNFIHTLPANIPSVTPSPEKAETETAAEITPVETPYPELLAAMQAYNERIYAEGQSGLVDAWSYTLFYRHPQHPTA